MLPVHYLTLFSAAALVVAEPTVPAFRAVTALARLNGDLPFVFGALEPRQGQCSDATETVCADGNGCCPIGAACVYTTTAGQVYGICEGACDVGAVTCTTPITACCNAGLRCGADGTCSAGSGVTFSSAPAVNTFTPTLTGATNTVISAGVSSAQASQSSALASISAAASRSSLSAAASRSSAQASFSSEQASLSSSLASISAAESLSSLSADASRSSSLASAISSASAAVASARPSAAGGCTSAHLPSWMSVLSAIAMFLGLV